MNLKQLLNVFKDLAQEPIAPKKPLEVAFCVDHIPGRGHVVYRKTSAHVYTPVEVICNRVAAFGNVIEAYDYAVYRNEMTAKYGSDDVCLIEHALPIISDR